MTEKKIQTIQKKQPEEAAILIPPLKEYEPAQNQAMKRVDHLMKTAHALAVMVHEENILLASAQASKIRENQPLKEQLCADYQTEMDYLAQYPPKPEERDEVRIADLKLLAQILQSILDTHLYMAKVAMSATGKVIENIRQEVAQQDGQNLRYNAQGTHGSGYQAVKQRASSVAVHKVI